MTSTATSPQSTHDRTIHDGTMHDGTIHDGGRPRPLRRPTDGRMLTGVAAGIADYARLDVTLVRIMLAVLVIAVGAGVPLYLAAWLLIPAQGSEQSIAGAFIAAHRPRSL